MTGLDDLPTTDSGHIKKADAMQWLTSLEEATPAELNSAVISKPTEFSGSTYPTEISTVRVTGAPAFVEAVASLLRPLCELENNRTRLELNLQRTEDRETGELTENYALYFSVAERG